MRALVISILAISPDSIITHLTAVSLVLSKNHEDYFTGQAEGARGTYICLLPSRKQCLPSIKKENRKKTAGSAQCKTG